MKSLDIKKDNKDGIPSIFVKSCDRTSYSLQQIFNRSLNDGVLPDQWKEALIPIFKSEFRHIISNYRHIFSQYLEKF